MPATILVVDDERNILLTLSQALQLEGYKVELASDAQVALDIVAARPIDAVLMDVKMPVMDGVQATRLIRALPAPVSALPILALTANADPRDEADYLAAGMDGVAQKPIQPDVMLDAIRRVLSATPDDQAAQAA